MPGNHGGQRPGAGRPSNASKYEPQITQASDHLAEYLPLIAEELINLSLGLCFDEKKVPAGLLTRKTLEIDDKGKGHIVETLVYPELPADELVVVERRTHAPDVKAIAEVWDRLGGKPRQALELNNGDDGPLRIEVVYVDADRPSGVTEPACGPGEYSEGEAAV